MNQFLAENPLLINLMYRINNNSITSDYTIRSSPCYGDPAFKLLLFYSLFDNSLRIIINNNHSASGWHQISPPRGAQICLYSDNRIWL